MLNKVWFITGCSSGFGKVLAKTLLYNNYRVCVTARHKESLEEFRAFPSEQCLISTLDVTKPEQVKEVVHEAITYFGQIDVLVNNAGYGLFGAVEEATESQFRDVMETNVFGLFNVTRAVLPFMRQRWQGHVFNISSISGVAGSAGSGLYNASKFAVEGMSEALYFELRDLGIKVTLIEPGAFRTAFAGRSVQMAENIIDDYKATAYKSRDYIININGRQPGDPQKLAKAIITLSQHPSPPLRMLFGKDALTRAEVKIKKWQDMIEEWKPLTLHMDFDDPAT